MTIIERIYNNVTGSPARIILSDEHGEYSNRDVWDFSSRVYAYLLAHDVGKESIVLVSLPRSATSVMVMLGVIRAGAAVVMSEDWGGSQSKEWREYVAGEVKPAIVVDQRLMDVMMECRPKDGFVIPDLHDLAYITYTTGTTGKRKGVMLEHGTIERYNSEVYLQDAEVSKTLDESSAITVTLNSAVIFLLLNLANNAPSDIVPHSVFGSWPDFINRLDDKKITTFACSALDLSRHGIPETPYLHFVSTSYEPACGLYSDRIQLVNEYGMTETGTTVTAFFVDRKYDIVPIGKPLPGFSVMILDEKGNEVPAGEYGEICIDCIYCRGYVNQPELTAEHFRDGLFYSHDLGKRLPDGNLVMCGRMNDSLLTDSGRIIGLEIELAVQKVLVHHGAYVKIFKTSEFPIICLYTDFDIDFPRLQEDLKGILPEYEIPTHHVRVSRFTHRNGKVIRSLLLPPECVGGVVIRDATAGDAPFIAWAMTESIDDCKIYYRQILDACLSDDSIYSFRRTRIAEIGGRPIGCQVVMSGMDYKVHRKKTWLAIWNDILTDELIDKSPLEAEEDECFLNGIAVLPEYRGQNLSERLVFDAVRIGEKMGFRKSTFVVYKNKPRLVEYYLRMGFEVEKEFELFGTSYIKMTIG